jgi:hypothetical protein
MSNRGSCKIFLYRAKFSPTKIISLDILRPI